MSVFNIFSKRQKRLRGEIPQVYSYTEMPLRLRVQILYIVKDVVNADPHYETSDPIYRRIVNILRREYGVLRLIKDHPFQEEMRELIKFVITKETEQVLDVMEVLFALMPEHGYAKSAIDDAVKELNARFREHRVGYRF